MTIVDGVLAGERNGPMHQSPKEAKVLLAGFNPLVVDTVSAYLMGFNPYKIPQLSYAYKPHHFPLAPCKIQKIVIIEDGAAIPFNKWKPKNELAFQPPATWRGHIERKEIRAILEEQDPSPVEFADEGGE